MIAVSHPSDLGTTFEKGENSYAIPSHHPWTPRKAPVFAHGAVGCSGRARRRRRLQVDLIAVPRLQSVLSSARARAVVVSTLSLLAMILAGAAGQKWV